MIYASMGDNDQAMHWLERAYEERFNPSILLRSGFDPLRSDPRFEELMRRIGLPESRMTLVLFRTRRRDECSRLKEGVRRRVRKSR